jgi:hypothetical protein
MMLKRTLTDNTDGDNKKKESEEKGDKKRAKSQKKKDGQRERKMTGQDRRSTKDKGEKKEKRGTKSVPQPLSSEGSFSAKSKVDEIPTLFIAPLPPMYICPIHQGLPFLSPFSPFPSFFPFPPSPSPLYLLFRSRKINQQGYLMIQ